MSTTDEPHLTIERLLAHRSWLRAVARSLVADEHAADDLVQDTFVAGLRRPPHDQASIRAWLRTVARNLARDRHRVAQARARREARNAVDESLVATVDVVERAELQRELTRHVLALAEPYRTTVLLRYFDELPPRDVAERMGVPVETVRTRARRALAKLRESLGEERGDDWRLALVPLVAGPVAPAHDPWIGSDLGPGSAPGTLAPLAVAGGVAIVAAAALIVVVMESDAPPRPETADTATMEPEPAIAPERDHVAQDGPEPGTQTEAEALAPAMAPAPAPAEKADGAAPIISRAPSRSELPLGGEWTSAPPPAMAAISGHAAQVIGMDESEIREFLTKDLGRDLGSWERFPFIWDYGFLFMTPRHTIPVPAFAIGRFEVTNAQWQVFLDSPENQASWQTSTDLSLKEIVAYVYHLDAETNPVDAQSAGLQLFRRNSATLRSLMNPDDDPEWEPLLAWVRGDEVPAGTTLEFGRIPPPSYWRDGRPGDAERRLPVSAITRLEARAFCHWAGFRLALEAEWERAARGNEARRFPWGDAWAPERAIHKQWPGWGDGEPQPQPVDSLAEAATPEGVHHLLGNVSEYVFDIARTYEGSRTKFKFDGMGFLARGGSYVDEEHVMLAADRIWDMGSSPIGPDSRADTFGFRLASYPQPGRDLALELATYAREFDRLGGVAHWLPVPAGLTRKEATIASSRRRLQGFALERSAGWMERRLDPDAADHAYVRGPARGIALLPIKGVASTYLKNAAALKRWSLADDETAFVGAILTTSACTITLHDDAGEPFTFDMGDVNSDAWADHDLGFPYQVGLWLVLRGDRVAVFGGNGSAAGVNGKHLAGTPLGYLPEPWAAEWAVTSEVTSGATEGESGMQLTVPLPQLNRTGAVKRGGKTALVTIRVPVIFAD